ncbi:hypothetical protein [Staphylococcus equorum]|uniref:hypothetical protein n=1 Tax=Staphylococcus equorum TaxID=246432 RepID=UPI003EB7C73D
MKKNLKQEELLLNDETLSLDKTEDILSKELENSFKDLELLKSEKELIKHPENLGKIILNEVWNQFENQIGLDITNETLIQKYDKANPQSYSELKDSVMKDPNYIKANKQMKEQQEAGILTDAYTGKKIEYGKDKANLDHVISRKKIFEDERRKQANLEVSELANRERNLRPTNESLNKSKGAKSNKEYIKKRKERELDLVKQNEKEKQKINNSKLSDIDKQKLKEKHDKRLNDKLSAKDNLMKKEEKQARVDYNRKVYKNVTKEVGKKATKDALKIMAVSALFALSKEIMNGLIRFLKQKSKSFKLFLEELKQSLKDFFTKFKSLMDSAATNFISTIISEIFGPIVSVFKKLSSLIKQGVSSIREAISYLADKSNKNKPMSVKLAQIGKIITTSIAGGSAVFLGEIFEKALLTFPVFQITIPLLGSLANIIGLFLSSIVSGVIGAIILNMIDKFITKKIEAEQNENLIRQKNKLLQIQDNQRIASEKNIAIIKNSTIDNIQKMNNYGNEEIEKSLNNIYKKKDNEITQIDSIDSIDESQTELDNADKLMLTLQKDLEDLM